MGVSLLSLTLFASRSLSQLAQKVQVCQLQGNLQILTSLLHLTLYGSTLEETASISLLMMCVVNSYCIELIYFYIYVVIFLSLNVKSDTKDAKYLAIRMQS